MLAAKLPRAKKCRVPECGASFVPQKLGQAVCSPACAIIDAPRNQAKARKALAQVERSEIKVRKEKLKSRSDHMKDTQQAFNEWVRHRDASLPCVSCGRHHEGKYDAGHYRTVGSNPALRFEPLNCHRQCSPCNTQLSGNIVNYRIELVRRIGVVNVEWLEGPHEPQKYTIEELKSMTAKYRALTRELKKGEAA
ncbi:recombination protein NinG [Pseudomonas ficuserectae]|uniref:Recombination protein NinG n=2 Tax=Pseudomonas amygdali pv. lachrymans TaxID=53707 RepID=A0AAD0LZE3_PSEAV|nr:recombination protein NinG [Pseudomonas amygdali]AXH55478.1 recombination protein NinG [Pseudomonas amygdali pv. lachrymans str. M301315]AXH56296.1 recombination protein NinG [Pseudomonas amygdali pv. lachrymans str. M301315]KKY52685.1 bacteriophage lambda NinG family protein [Pseudomonas amygdali pv. lachrymans]KPC02842.1 Bacteriophage lambda NinG [Pseudomonas amygdali pv. lachrymans]KPC20390.1 Bacteriophage lambda NinG [Pseudomonas amygdali pv. lachrymans]